MTQVRAEETNMWPGKVEVSSEIKGLLRNTCDRKLTRFTQTGPASWLSGPPAAKPGDLSPVPSTHTAEGEVHLLQIVSNILKCPWYTHAHRDTRP